jgi:hypothetical protein
MKTSINILALAVTIIAANACQKEPDQTLLKPKNSVTSDQLSVPGLDIGEYTIWDPYTESCVTTTEKVCCARPGTSVQVAPVSFINAFQTNQLPSWFNNNDYQAIWPQLQEFPDLIDDIIAGDYRTIKIENLQEDMQYFLFGPTMATNQEITENPVAVVSLPL